MKVELLEVFGDDLTIVNVARVSYGKESQEFSEKDSKLIKYLIKNNHTSPLRHPQLRFRITCPIFVERQLFKHQVGLSANCLHGDTEITFIKSSGQLNKVKIKDLFDKFNNGRFHQNTPKDKEYSQTRIKNMKCRVLNEHTGEFEISNLANVFQTGVKKLYTITLQDGKKLICTDQHKILTSDGWKTISNGLSTSHFVATNGVKYVGDGNYRNYDTLLDWKNQGLSIKEMSEIANCSYHTIKKWLRNHSLQFDKSHSQFKKGDKPWNKDKSGYKLNFSEEGYLKKKQVARNQPKGSLSPAWRGGITSERDKIGQWTRSVAKEVYKKYNYTCQECGEGGELQAHHIIPVTTDISYAYNINNLVCVCRNCHSKIHKSKESEFDFALRFYNLEEIKSKSFGKNSKNRVGNKLKVKYSKIEKIEYFGEDVTYDIEMKAPHHNFVANGFVVHNSISGRYVDFSDSYFEITELREQSKDSKQGSGERIEKDLERELICEMNDLVNQAKKLYAKLVVNGVSKEQARFILPLSLNTTFIWTGSLLAFLNLFDLRLKPDAQKETRLIAEMMYDEIVKSQKFNSTIEAWRET